MRTLRGWLGGTVLFAHGMRVVNDRDVEASEAIKPAVSGDGAERAKRSVVVSRAS